MGQLFFTDQNGRRWLCGWYNPSQGYYASRENNELEPCAVCPTPDGEEKDCVLCPMFDAANRYQEFDVLIGFGKGIPTLGDFTAECYEHGLELTMEQVKELADDRACQERPLTPLQEKIHDIFEKCEWNVNPTVEQNYIERIRDFLDCGQWEWGKMMLDAMLGEQNEND